MSFARVSSQFIHRLLSSLTFVERTYMGASSSRNRKMNAPAIVPPSDVHDATLIFLHGLGDTGHGWADGFQMLKFKHIKCVFPNAPIQKVTLNAGMRMPSWFDIHGLSPDSQEDDEGIEAASQTLQALMDEELKTLSSPSKLFIGGFSQGGSVALYTAFVMDKPVGGVVALSTWFPLHKKLKGKQPPTNNKEVPVLQGHGACDPLVQFSWGEKTNQILRSFNGNAEFKRYEGLDHGSCAEEMRDVKAFLEAHSKN